MIEKANIEQLAREKLEDGMFLVEVLVNPSNVIKVFVDSFDGVSIENCIAISRHIEHNLDRERDDFELQVSSPGLSEPLKVKEQYLKNTGRQLEVDNVTGQKFTGLLKIATPDYILIESSNLEKVEGSKKKQLTIKEHHIEYSEIKSAKVVVSFK